LLPPFFFFFFSYSKEGDRSFVISRFCFAATKQNYHYLLISSFDAAKKATTPFIFAFIATKKAIAAMVPSLSFFFRFVVAKNATATKLPSPCFLFYCNKKSDVTFFCFHFGSITMAFCFGFVATKKVTTLSCFLICYSEEGNCYHLLLFWFCW